MVTELTIKTMNPITPKATGIKCDRKDRFAWCFTTVSGEIKYTISGNKNGANKTLK